jgi:hypothetical protein
MWGDPVGYYVYSPALFIYGFDASKMPDGIVDKTGQGFIIDENGKIITRYSYGVAILQAPVFLAVHLIAGISGQLQDGFSGIYHLVSSFAAILYSFLGLIFLWIYLRKYFKKTIVFFSIATILLGTNLLYYTIDATGMSHVYSFFLFSVLLFISKLFFEETEVRKKNRCFIGISLVSALIILIRPTNIVFVGLVFMLDVSSRKDFITKIKQVFKPGNIFILLISFMLVFLPQMMYWKYASGSFFTDPYKGFGFSNLASPQIIEFLFSTNNGLFLYNPLYFLIIFALLFMIRKKQNNGYYILGISLGLIYIFSSWFVFSFGCGFGSRNFVEYTTVFALPLGYLYQESGTFSGWWRKILFVFAFLFILVNVKLVSAYDKCFLGKDWDFKEYTYFLKSREFNKEILIFRKEFLTSKKEFSKAIRIDLKKCALVNFRRAIVSVDAKIYHAGSEAMIVMTITSGDSTIYWNGYPLKNSYNFEKAGVKQKITGDFWLPRYYTTNSEISTYIWNSNRDSLQISGLKIHLR